jgi:hypothetical protein
MDHKKKALRLANTIAKKSTKQEKREVAHVLCQYYVALLADGARKNRVR